MKRSGPLACDGQRAEVATLPGTKLPVRLVRTMSRWVELCIHVVLGLVWTAGVCTFGVFRLRTHVALGVAVPRWWESPELAA